MKKQIIKSRKDGLISATALGFAVFASSVASAQQVVPGAGTTGQWVPVPGISTGISTGVSTGGIQATAIQGGIPLIPGYQPVNVLYSGPQIVQPQISTGAVAAPVATAVNANVRTSAYTGPVYNLPSVQAAQRLPAETLNGPVVTSISTPLPSPQPMIKTPVKVVVPAKIEAPVMAKPSIEVERQTYRAAIPGDFYIGAKALVQDPKSFTWDSQASATNDDDHVRTLMDDGRTLLLSAGVPLNMGLPVSGLNIEGEAGYRLARVESMSSNATAPITDPGGKLKILSGAMNLVKEFKTASNWGGYLGGGLGLAELEHEKFRAASGLPNGMTADDEWNLMFNSFGGLSYQLNPSTKVLAEVRRTLFPDVTRVADDGSTLDDTYVINEGGLGLKVGF